MDGLLTWFVPTSTSWQSDRRAMHLSSSWWPYLRRHSGQGPGLEDSTGSWAPQEPGRRGSRDLYRW